MPKKEKKIKKNKYEGENIEEWDTPMYRSYGRVKKINPRFEKFKETVCQGILIWFLLWIGIIFCLILYAMIAYSDVLAFLISLIVGIIVTITVSRAPRKRIAFIRKLKRACRKNGWEYYANRRFFASFLWNEREEEDFSVRTRTHTYLVKYATAKKRYSDMIFLSKNKMIYRKLRLNNKFTVAFDLKPKVTEMNVRFPQTDDGGYTVKAILINPVPRDIFKKDSDGSIVATGSGEKLFGYTVFSGSGFISTLEREDETIKRVYFE